MRGSWSTGRARRARLSVLIDELAAVAAFGLLAPGESASRSQMNRARPPESSGAAETRARLLRADGDGVAPRRTPRARQCGRRGQHRLSPEESPHRRRPTRPCRSERESSRSERLGPFFRDGFLPPSPARRRRVSLASTRRAAAPAGGTRLMYTCLLIAVHDLDGQLGMRVHELDRADDAVISTVRSCAEIGERMMPGAGASAAART